MESMLRSSPPGVSSSAGARGDRDGSLSRILASSAGGPGGGGLSRSRPGSSHSASTAASPSALSALALSNRSLLRRASRSNAARAAAAGGGAGDVEEWRVLHELPEGGDVMDIDEAVDLNIMDDEEVGESGELVEVHDEDDDDEEHSDEDSEAESAFDEVHHADLNNADNDDNHDDEDENNEHDNDDDDSDPSGEEEDEENNFDEETDDDECEETYDTSQFDDAVINLDDINITLGSTASRDDRHHHHQSSGGNPHRHSLGRSPSSRQASGGSSSGNNSGGAGPTPMEVALKKREREQAFLCAAMSILAAQYPLVGGSNNHGSGAVTVASGGDHNDDKHNNSNVNRFSIYTRITLPPPNLLLTSNAEQSLLKSCCNIIKPPRKPLNLKIFLRRAPTQEEFFRGSLSRNPIGLSSLRAAGGTAAGSGGGGGDNDNDRRSSSGGTASSKNDEPLVSDLRAHIAKDLQMSDSAELLELLCANKILSLSLPLRVVQQVLWKTYVEENATSASSLGVAGAGPSHQMISTGSGLSMIFSSSGLVAARNRSAANAAASGGAGGGGADDNAILASFPPMVITYRLAGVDGEATEDTVDDLDDPEAPSQANSTPQAIERRMEKEYGITRMITRQRNSNGGGVGVLLASVQNTISDLLRRIRRDEVSARHCARQLSTLAATTSTAVAEDGNSTRQLFAKAPPCPALVLLRHCANIGDNRKMMLSNRAPTVLLRILLDILNAMNRSDSTTGRKGKRRSSTFDLTSSSMDVDTAVGASVATPRSKVHHVEGNPTTEALQEIIEMLASDISAEISDESNNTKSLSKSSSLSKMNRSGSSSKMNRTGSFVNLEQQGQQEDDRTLPLVLKSLHSTELSPPLRKVIAKLLPFLTYGQVSQSRELARYFGRYVNVHRLGMMEGGQGESVVDNASSAPSELQLDSGTTSSSMILMNTFVETAINLPPVSVCGNLRLQLINNGFVERVRTFLLEDVPGRPPCWSPALYSKVSKKIPEGKELKAKEEKGEDMDNKEEWRKYFDRPGLSQGFKILTGLCMRHDATQLLLSDIYSDDDDDDLMEEGEDEKGTAEKKSTKDDKLILLTLCHWLESTSDNTSSSIKNPNGILAETLLDALKEDNDATSAKIGTIRKKTRDRKRELAEERRSKALVGMSAFGRLAGSAVAGSESRAGAANLTAAGSVSAQGNDAGVEAGDGSSAGSENRSMFASMFSSLLAPASSSTSSNQPRTTRASSRGPADATTSAQPKAQPSWMAEMEAMDDEAGVTCAVCQEGRTLLPSELLGLYAYMKKVSIPSSQGGARGDVDGTVLLLSLPISCPASLMNSNDGTDVLFQKARNAANALEGSSHALSAMSASSASASITGGSSRNNYYVTTVSAGNAIHCSCHKRAKAADRNHPKAPKSEWEGASLRNSRVSCNVILPLVSSKTFLVPLMAVETALADYNIILTNTLNSGSSSRPKSILWNCLHDMRFLLLRMAHGEALGADCGGGSSSSNFLLLLYEMYSADMFATNAEHDESVEVSRHARGLSAGFLVGVDIVEDVDFERKDGRSKRLERGVADAAPMAALLSILFLNTNDKSSSNNNDSKEESKKTTPSPTRQWEQNKSKFLAGLIRCAGHRHSLGVTDSGCVTSRGISTGRQKNVEKARSFANWSSGSGDDTEPSALTTTRKSSSRRTTTMIQEYSTALRPMITLYAMFDQLSKEFVVNNDDESTEESSERLAAKMESCYKADSMEELLRVAEITLGNDVICKYFEKGATS